MFRLEVVTPERVVFSNDISSLIVPGIDGQLGILTDHAPMVAALGAGVVKYRVDGEFRRMAVSGGFLEVADNKAVIITDAAELAGEIDVLRARAAKERAQRRLAQKSEEVDFERAQAALQRALARLRAAGVDIKE